MKKNKISINGKFFGATGTGVQRVAEELIIAIDHVLTKEPTLAEKFDIEIIAPTNVTVRLNLQNITVRQAGILSGYLKNIPWEQLNLPFLVKDRTLLSLCNLSSIFIKNAVVMIHDAQVYITPESYSFGFKDWYKFVLPRVGKNSKKILTVSEYSKAQLAHYEIAEEQKITVVHNGCDHILRAESDDQILDRLQLGNKPYCIAQANTQTHKNISVLLQAFADVALKDATLVLYGGTTKQEFESLGFVIPNNVVFTGRVNDSELKALIENALATLTPSLTEGFGLQPLEGMALGVPAIIAPKGALAEVCGDVGLYANPYQPEAWVKAIVYLIENPQFVQTHNEKVKTHAEQYSWENAARRILELIDRLESNTTKSGLVQG